MLRGDMMAYLTSGRNKIMGSSVSTDANVVTVIDASCTDEQVPTAKAVYDEIKALRDIITDLTNRLDALNLD